MRFMMLRAILSMQSQGRRVRITRLEKSAFLVEGILLEGLPTDIKSWL
jgi:hypothetical protein